jgi:hypothetical protein
MRAGSFEQLDVAGLTDCSGSYQGPHAKVGDPLLVAGNASRAWTTSTPLPACHRCRSRGLPPLRHHHRALRGSPHPLFAGLPGLLPRGPPRASCGSGLDRHARKDSCRGGPASCSCRCLGPAATDFMITITPPRRMPQLTPSRIPSPFPWFQANEVITLVPVALLGGSSCAGSRRRDGGAVFTVAV